MEIGFLYVVFIFIIAYAGLKLFSWHESNKQGKSAFWTRNLIQTNRKKE